MRTHLIPLISKTWMNLGNIMLNGRN
jgi:hypothetical protein